MQTAKVTPSNQSGYLFILIKLTSHTFVVLFVVMNLIINFKFYFLIKKTKSRLQAMKAWAAAVFCL